MPLTKVLHGLVIKQFLQLPWPRRSGTRLDLENMEKCSFYSPQPALNLIRPIVNIFILFFQECVYDIRHPNPAGGQLSMKFNDLRLHNSDRIEVGAFKFMVTRQSDIISQQAAHSESLEQAAIQSLPFISRAFRFRKSGHASIPQPAQGNADCLIATFNCYGGKLFINPVFYESRFTVKLNLTFKFLSDEEC